jgi:hypothetical protein
MSYDVHKNPVQLSSAAWPYPCPIGQANGLAKDSNLGLWTTQHLLPTWNARQVSAPGVTYPLIFNGWTENVSVGSIVLANTLCTPLQVVACVTLRAALVLNDTEYVQMVAWTGQSANPTPANRQSLPQYGTAHVHDPSAPGAVPVNLSCTLTRRLTLPANGSATLYMYQGIYHNYNGNSTSSAPSSASGVRPLSSSAVNVIGQPITVGPPVPVGTATLTPGYATSFSTELTAQGWPSLSAVSDG